MQQDTIVVADARNLFSVQRSATRFGVCLPVELRLAGGRLRGLARNLSLGGALVELPVALTARTRVAIHVTLPERRGELVLESLVRRNEPGLVAFSFERLGSGAIWSLGDYFETL
jgi:hypothetical protein